MNHPISGPVFSGPHLPLLCTVPQPAAEPSRDATCADSTSTEYAYKNTAGDIGPLSGPDQRPADLANVTIDGKSVPYIVRVERGVINRSPYSFAVLDDADGWNQRLVYEFGGGCGTPYSQGGSLGTNVVDDALLVEGLRGRHRELQHLPDVLQRRALGRDRDDGQGARRRDDRRTACSRSATARRVVRSSSCMIAQNYPGILDALSPVIPFPDAISIAPGVSDCGLLAHYYASPLRAGLDRRRNRPRSTGTGPRGRARCGSRRSSAASIRPTGATRRSRRTDIFSADEPEGHPLHPCRTLNRNEFGIDPTTGFARRPLDNVGVQYGLAALNAGTITVDQFLDLNESIGGYDINGQPVAERETARPADFRRGVRDRMGPGRGWRRCATSRSSR